MKRLLQLVVFSVGLTLTTMRAVASPEVEMMSDLEVSEYAVRMSRLLESIQQYRLCPAQDAACVRAEFERRGISYDDKELVQKRLVLMIGSIY